MSLCSSAKLQCKPFFKPIMTSTGRMPTLLCSASQASSFCSKSAPRSSSQRGPNTQLLLPQRSQSLVRAAPRGRSHAQPRTPTQRQVSPVPHGTSTRPHRRFPECKSPAGPGPAPGPARSAPGPPAPSRRSRFGCQTHRAPPPRRRCPNQSSIMMLTSIYNAPPRRRRSRTPAPGRRRTVAAGRRVDTAACRNDSANELSDRLGAASLNEKSGFE